MYENLENIIAEFARNYTDSREHVFNVTIEFTDTNSILLRGRVLELQMQQALEAAIMSLYPTLKMDFSAVEVLSHPHSEKMTVATNLTSFHVETSFQSEMLCQSLYGFGIEVLEEKGSWGYVRREDGYLGWTYLPYCQPGPVETPTHLVCQPVTPLYADPQHSSALLTRVLGGMPVRLLETEGEWCLLQANNRGWVPRDTLRSLQEMPQTAAERRRTMAADALAMIGVPYLWGGDSANGIDCSGFARLIHLLSGIKIRRDADMQYADSRKVEPPFQPGDLLFFGDREEDGKKITHVTISLGGWEIIHSSRAQNGVYKDDVQQVPHLRDSFLFAGTYLA